MSFLLKNDYFCPGVSAIQPAPSNPPGAEASKGNRLSGVLWRAYSFFFPF
jgi:hypothetical protein